jgi:hypothetical protein
VITYDLRCSAAHQFEGWFASSADYDLQHAQGMILCPVCDDSYISKAPSAPYVSRKGNQSSAVKQNAPEVEAETPSASPALAVTNAEPMSAAVQGVIEKLAAIQTEVLKESTWVGRDFAEEARAIHYGESEDRRIHGEASPHEAQALSEEGISVAALPLPFVPPRAKN